MLHFQLFLLGSFTGRVGIQAHPPEEERVWGVPEGGLQQVVTAPRT